MTKRSISYRFVDYYSSIVVYALCRGRSAALLLYSLVLARLAKINSFIIHFALLAYFQTPDQSRLFHSFCIPTKDGAILHIMTTAQAEHNNDNDDAVAAPFLQPPETIAPDRFVCPLTLEIMRDPVMSRYGQSFERRAIMQWLAVGNVTCPLTRQRLRLSDLISNPALRVEIRKWQRDHDGCSDINLVMDVPDDIDDDDVSRIFGYFTLPEKEETQNDTAERTHDDPDVIVEARHSPPPRTTTTTEHTRRSLRYNNSRAISRPQRSVHTARSGLFGRFLLKSRHRALAA